MSAESQPEFMSVTTAENQVEPPVVATLAAPPAEAPSEHGWVWQVTALSVLLGVMLALAIQTTSRIKFLGLPSNRFGVSAATLSRYKDQNEKLQVEISELRDRVNEFRLSTKDGDRASTLLKQQLADYEAVLGFAPVKGPGLVITLHHSPIPLLQGTVASDYLANNDDVNGLVSELWAAGAEAIAISGAGAPPQRFMIATTVQPAGEGVMVNGRVLKAPFRIQVIGNPKELRAAVRMPDGIVSARGLEDLKMIEIKESEQLVLPAFSRGGSAGNAQTTNQ